LIDGVARIDDRIISILKIKGLVKHENEWKCNICFK
jgi:hypothetical protein